MNPTVNNFEQLYFNPFPINDSTFEDDLDPDLHYFNEVAFNTPYVFQEEIKDLLYETKQYANISLLHLNIRSLNANFENFRDLLEQSDSTFNIICLTETWSSDADFHSTSLYQLPHYKAIHFERKINKKGGGVLIYVKDDLKYKTRQDLCISDINCECLTIEIINKDSKNFLVSCCYKPPNGNTMNLSEHLINIFQHATSENKLFFILGDFNLNCLDFGESSEIKNFYNGIFEHGAIPLITRPTRVTNTTATLIDNILTNCVFDISLKKGIIKTSITDHFPIFAAITISKTKQSIKKIKIKKRNFDDSNKSAFREELIQTDWSFLHFHENPNIMYEEFLKIFSKIYDKYFPLLEIEVKTKDIKNPWMSKGMKKSSKKKQRLYIKFLKIKTPESEKKYKDFKQLFEKLKKKSKKLYYSSLLNKYQNNSKKTWEVMKELTGKVKSKSQALPAMLKTQNGDIENSKKVAEEFNCFFTNIGPKLGNNILSSENAFKDYLNKENHCMENNELSIKEFENAFACLKKIKPQV